VLQGKACAAVTVNAIAPPAAIAPEIVLANFGNRISPRSSSKPWGQNNRMSTLCLSFWEAAEESRVCISVKQRNRPASYYVYMMASPSLTLYTGVTNDLERRVAEHKSGTGSRFTSRYHTTRLVYCEEFSDINLAIEREKQIKGLRREKKIALVETLNPAWQDLSEADQNGILRCADSAQNDKKWFFHYK